MHRTLIVGTLGLVMTVTAGTRAARAIAPDSLISRINADEPVQAQSVLHIKVALVDAAQTLTPVPRHQLLISENPASAAPRLIVTGVDGTADVRLRPGNYTVESDRPVTFHGNAYEWRQVVDVHAGRDTTLELTAANAEVSPAANTGATDAAAPPALEADPAFLLPRWRNSVVALWTATARLSGFVIDAAGLVVTNQRAIGNATTVEVQLSPTVKIAGTVLAADRVHDVAVIWIDPQALASVKPVPLACPQDANTHVEAGQEIFAIGVPVRQQQGMASAAISRVDKQDIITDLTLARGAVGGPVFTAAGDLIGITSVPDENDRRSRGNTRIVRTDEACAVIASAQKKMKNVPAPDAAHLPVEPPLPYPVDALRDLATQRTGTPSPYELSTPTFDIALITPVLTYAARYQSEHGRPRTTSADTRKPEPEQQSFIRPLIDFSNWSDYVGDDPPVLLVRVTPKMVEGFWTTVARGAARTQGVSIPPIKHFASSFLRLRAFCGDSEVAPIHPFKLEQRLSETEAIYEGLYAFDPGALNPECASVKLVLYAEKDPEKGDTRVVDAALIKQIWQDFAPYRAR